MDRQEFFLKNTTDGKFVPYFPERAWLVPLAFAILAGGIMYLTLLFNFSKKIQYMLLLTGGIVASVTLLKFGGILTRQLLALIAATVFPVLSMTVIVELWESCKKKYPKHAEDYYQCYMAAGFGCDTFFNWSIFCSGCFRRQQVFPGN